MNAINEVKLNDKTSQLNKANLLLAHHKDEIGGNYIAVNHAEYMDLKYHIENLEYHLKHANHLTGLMAAAFAK